MATKKPGTGLTLWEQEMKATAVKQASSEKIFAGVKRIQITGGRMKIDENYIEGDTLDVVVIGAVHLNEYYRSQYDASKPTVPDCYAYGDNSLDDVDAIEAAMAPGEVEDKQSDSCAECPLNVMGSADVGRGKACKNVRRLMLVTSDALESPEALLEAEERSLGVPVMSVFGWAKYVKEVLGEELQRPYFGVVTTVSVVPDPKSQFKLTFAFKELINFDQAMWDAMKKRVADAGKALVMPYPKQADLDAAAPPARGNSKLTGGKKVIPIKPAAKAAPAKKAPAKR